jgi:hypothetical protein
MSNTKQGKTQRLNRAERAEELRKVHFPDVASPYIWHRKTHDGYTTVPRTLPIAMQAVDALCKGQPAGHVLLCLWARYPDNALITIDSQTVFAAEAGFSGERAVDTWRKRMKHLRTYGLIETKPGASGDLHYVLLINPNYALEALRAKKHINDSIYGRFVERMHEIGATAELGLIQDKLKADDPSKGLKRMPKEKK